MTVTIEVLASAALVAAVIFAMWRTPVRDEAYFGWAPSMALMSVWTGLAATVFSAALWGVRVPDRWLTLVFLLLDPVSIGAGVLVLWIYRGHKERLETIDAQRLQAKVGIALGLLAVVLGYVFVMTHKHVFTPVGV